MDAHASENTDLKASSGLLSEQTHHDLGVSCHQRSYMSTPTDRAARAPSTGPCLSLPYTLQHSRSWCCLRCPKKQYNLPTVPMSTTHHSWCSILPFPSLSKAPTMGKQKKAAAAAADPAGKEGSQSNQESDPTQDQGSKQGPTQGA